MNAIAQAISMASVLMLKTPTRSDIHNLVQGFTSGLIAEESLTSFPLCHAQVLTMVPIIKKAEVDAKAGNMADVIADLTQAAALAPQVISVCQGMQTDIARLGQWFSIFTNPDVASIIEGNLAKSPLKVAKDVADAKNSISADNYNKAGVDMADLSVLALGPIPSASEWEFSPSAWMFQY